MMKVMHLGRTLLLALAVGLIATAGANAGDTKKAPKTNKSAKAQSTEPPPEVRMTLEPKAVEILKAACNRLAAARTMSFTAMVTYENPSRLGTPLAFTTKSEVILQRPDRLRVITPADGPPSEFYYDGKKMVAFAPVENLVAVAAAPSTIDAMLKAAYDSAAIYFPFTDLIVADPYGDIADGLVIAFYIGQSQVVGGTTTDMIAYANNDVFLQAWIGVEDKLPRRVQAVYREDPARLRHQLELSNWQIDPAVPADAFAATSAANAKPITFALPNAPQGAAVRPPAKKSGPVKAREHGQ